LKEGNAMRFKTVVGQVAQVGGHRYDQAHGILAHEPTSRFARGRGRGNLYVLVEVSGPARARDLVADRLADLIREVYYGQRGSVTAALREAIRAGNKLLADENRQSMPDQQWTAGLSCAVLREENLFIAQAGPAALYVTQRGQVIRYPDLSPWLDQTPFEASDAAPLGKRRDVHVDLFHTQLSDNNSFLLVNSGIARELHPQAWPHILIDPSISSILKKLSAAAQSDELLALVVRLGEGEEDLLPVQVPPPARVEAPPPSVPEQEEVAPGEVEAPSTGPSAPSASQGGAVEASFPLQPGSDGPPPSPPLPELVDEPPPGRDRRRQQDRRTRPAGQALAAAGATLAAFLKGMAPSQPKLPAASKPRTDVESRAQASKPAWEAAPRRTHSARVQKLLLAIAIAIPIVVGALAVWMVIQRGQDQQAEVEQLWQSANTIWLETRDISDPPTVRARLTEADGYLEQLLEEQPDNPEALELRRRIQSRLEESNQVRRVAWAGELKTYPSNAELSRVIVEGVHVFVLDSHNNQVYHHQMDELQQALLPERDTVLVRKGNEVGAVLVADLIDMTWMPAGNGRQKAGLVILESGGTLLDYDPITDELVPLEVAASDTWQLPQLVGSHSGRFYLLDPTGNHIWRYTATPDGYGQRPDEWLQEEVDLLGIRDMAVGDSIYLLFADGTMQKLSQGRTDAFDISDWDTPPQGPTAIFTRPPNDTQWVYVADPGNNRIVQSSKSGQFARQFRLAESTQGSDGALASVTSLFVDEIGGRAFFVSGDSLHMIVLPSD
jgi:hypothetical protein